MADVTRRDKALPVQARRAGGAAMPSQSIGVPNGAADRPTAADGGVPGAVQNHIYIVNPGGPAAPPPPPAEVHHHHHHTTTVVVPARRLRRSKGTSFLGTLGLVLGGLAGVTAFLEPVARFAVPMAVVALALAAVAWVGAVVVRRVGATMPFVGMVVSAVGYCLGLYQTGQAQATYDRLRARSPVPLPAVQFAASAQPTPAAVTGPSSTPGGAAPPAVPSAPAAGTTPPPGVTPHPIGGGVTLFGVGGGQPVKPATRP